MARTAPLSRCVHRASHYGRVLEGPWCGAMARRGSQVHEGRYGHPKASSRRVSVQALRPARHGETPRFRPMGQRLSTRATLRPVPGPLPHRPGHRTHAHAPGSAPGGLLPSGVLLLPCATEGCACVGQRSRSKPGASSSSCSGRPAPGWHETCGERGQGARVGLCASRLLQRRGAYEGSRRETSAHGSRALGEEGDIVCN